MVLVAWMKGAGDFPDVGGNGYKSSPMYCWMTENDSLTDFVDDDRCEEGIDVDHQPYVEVRAV